MYHCLTADDCAVGVRLRHGLTDDAAGFVGRVMEVDGHGSLGMDVDVDDAGPVELLQHVVEKADSGRGTAHAVGIQADPGPDLRLSGGALDARLAHAARLPASQCANL